jgi:hypothetical protein
VNTHVIHRPISSPNLDPDAMNNGEEEEEEENLYY